METPWIKDIERLKVYRTKSDAGTPVAFDCRQFITVELQNVPVLFRQLNSCTIRKFDPLTQIENLEKA